MYTMQVMALLLGGWMALRGEISGQQLTSFVLYTEFVMSASLSVCDQWGGVMEAIGASERVIEYLDHPPAPQIQPGTVPSSFSGQVWARGSQGPTGARSWARECINEYFESLVPRSRCMVHSSFSGQLWDLTWVMVVLDG